MIKRFWISIVRLIVPVAILWWATVSSCATDKNENYDSLFLGFHFGMERQAFYDYCWEMNKQKQFMHGPGNTSVLYQLKDDLDAPVSMQFYPSFHHDKIYEMPVTFSYEAWAPWNRQYWAGELLPRMFTVFKRWYGDENWQVIDHPLQGTVYARIDGHRRINLFKKDDQFVQAVFTDLKTERAKKQEEAAAEETKAENE